MNKSHYISLPLAQQLAAAGICFAESQMVWVNCELILPIGNRYIELKWINKFRLTGIGISCIREILNKNPVHNIELFPAPSTDEILDRLPRGYGAGWNRDSEGAWCGEPYIEMAFMFADTPPNAAAKMKLNLEACHDKRQI